MPEPTPVRTSASVPSATNASGPAPAPVRIAVLGAGGRGAANYGRWFADHPDRARLVAVAEPIGHRRDALADRAEVPAEFRYPSWHDLMADADRLHLDAVVVALPDDDHVEPTVAAAERGLAVLLEKPIAPALDPLLDLEHRLSGLKPRIAVAHVLRETAFWRETQQLISAGQIGDPVTIRIEENIGFWHFAHSYVRGNWRRTDTSSPMVLAKTCHDLDLIRWITGRAPERVSSMGSLQHFHAGNAPEGAPTHCAHGCPVADTCPFHAPRYYADALAHTDDWPVVLLGPDTSPEGRMKALETGPYGRCVYRCDNDAADHQQTVFAFPGGLTAALTTSAFTGANTRTFQVTGTRGELSGRMETGALRLEVFAPGLRPDLPDTAGHVRVSSEGPMGHEVHEWTAGAGGDTDIDHRGHAGGDDALTERFVDAVASGDFEGHVTTTLEASMDSHRMAFAAERSRLTGRTVEWEDFRR
ncbi:Gfo/Idh/MocA family protein [Nocardiopsis salina]|uniref:Gfo/Idh/MocA family protein n=1 Tax=Nocardiopsis salina TaxID=245836 RepID=UPI00037BAF0C|nr:Gfo/Idh/MocA family oxidoreductase [Nocardiopsis salina]